MSTSVGPTKEHLSLMSLPSGLSLQAVAIGSLYGTEAPSRDRGGGGNEYNATGQRYQGVTEPTEEPETTEDDHY